MKKFLKYLLYIVVGIFALDYGTFIPMVMTFR